MKKLLLGVSTLAFIASPVATIIACGDEDSHKRNFKKIISRSIEENGPLKSFKNGKVITGYVNSHDIVTSLRVPVSAHYRWDIASTKELNYEKYLGEFIDPIRKDKKIYNLNDEKFDDWDKERARKEEIDAFVNLKMDDSNGKIAAMRNKIDIYDADYAESIEGELLWKHETRHLAKAFDKMSKLTIFTERAEKIISEYEKREKELKKDLDELKKPLNVLVIMGEWHPKDRNEIINSIVAPARAHQLYQHEKIRFPDFDKELAAPVLSGQGIIYKYAGKATAGDRNTASNHTSVTQLEKAFEGKADKIIFLKDPYDVKGEKTWNNQENKPKTPDGGQHPKDENIIKKLKGMLNTEAANNFKKNIVISEYDTWGLSMNGGAIGANLSMDFIEKDIIENEKYVTNYTPVWKKLYDPKELLSFNTETKTWVER